MRPLLPAGPADQFSPGAFGARRVCWSTRRELTAAPPLRGQDRFTRLSACTSACKELCAKFLEMGWRKSLSGGDNRLH
jgi:hypothetical protein